MRQRISLVVAATTSAVIIAFVIPLCLLVQTLAVDRAVSAAQLRAQNAAVFVASLPDETRLNEALHRLGQPSVSVLLPSGTVLGPDDPPMATDPLVAQALAHRSAFTESGDDRVASLVAVARGDGLAVVRCVVTTADLRHGVGVAWATITGLGVLLFVLSLAVAWWLGRRISVPLTDLAAVAHSLRGGDLSSRATPSGPKEVTELGAALNQLAERIGELLVAEREVAADLSHRLRTPVTALRLDAELVDDPELGQRLASHVEALQRTVDAVVREARRPVRTPMRTGCDLAVVVADRVRFWAPLAEDQARTMTMTGPQRGVPVDLSADDVRDIVDNLLDNVFAHTPDGSQIEVAVSVDVGVPTLVVADAGPGVADPDATPRRGESGGGSTGLGLDIVRRLARSVDGSMALQRSRWGGLQVRISLGRTL